jgi:hypothetical protein
MGVEAAPIDSLTGAPASFARVAKWSVLEKFPGAARGKAGTADCVAVSD